MFEYPTRVRQVPVQDCAARGCRHRPTGSTGRFRPRPAVTGAELCEHHVFRFIEYLASLAELYPLVEGSLIKSRKLDETSIDTSGHSDVGTMWNQAAAQALADINSWIRNLVSIVNADRPGGPHVAEVTSKELLQLAVIRRDHARWLALYPTLGKQLLDEVVSMSGIASAAIDQRPRLRVVLNGRGCSQLEFHPDFGEYFCGGQLFGLLRTDDEEARIVCSVNPEHVIGRDDWMAHA